MEMKINSDIIDTNNFIVCKNRLYNNSLHQLFNQPREPYIDLLLFIEPFQRTRKCFEANDAN